MSKATHSHVGIRAMLVAAKRRGFTVFEAPHSNTFAVGYVPAPGGYFPGYPTREAAISEAYRAAIGKSSDIRVAP